MAYFAPEKSFLMDREEIKELEQIIQDVCGSTQPVGAALFDANEEDSGPLPWRRMEIVVDSMLAEISYRATRLHAIQFGAHLKNTSQFPGSHVRQQTPCLSEWGRMSSVRRGKNAR